MSTPLLDRFRLDGRVAVVTGATGEIGSVYARALAAAGATVVATSRTAAKLEALAGEIEADGGRAVWFPCELTDRDEVEAFTRQVQAEVGTVDILVNNAYDRPATVESLDLPPQAWEDTFEVIVWAPLVLCQRFGAGMIEQRRGSIVNIGSQAAMRPYRWTASYGAAKAAMHTITTYLAEAWGRHNVRCNTLVPSLMVSPRNTEMLRVMQDMGVLERAALGRAGDPEEMAAPLVFLASDASSYVTGQTLVSGGDLFPPIDRA